MPTLPVSVAQRPSYNDYLLRAGDRDSDLMQDDEYREFLNRMETDISLGRAELEYDTSLLQADRDQAIGDRQREGGIERQRIGDATARRGAGVSSAQLALDARSRDDEARANERVAQQAAQMLADRQRQFSDYENRYASEAAGMSVSAANRRQAQRDADVQQRQQLEMQAQMRADAEAQAAAQRQQQQAYLDQLAAERDVLNQELQRLMNPSSATGSGGSSAPRFQLPDANDYQFGSLQQDFNTRYGQNIQLSPGEVITMRRAAPGGGYIYGSNLGGIFNAEGSRIGYGGSNNANSYIGLAAGDRMGDRQIVDLRVDDRGYTQVGSDGSEYRFNYNNSGKAMPAPTKAVRTNPRSR